MNGEWGVCYFWFCMNWIARLDILLLALMLICVIVIFGRALYLYPFARRQEHRAASREYRELIAQLSIEASSIKSTASAAPFVGLVGTCFGISSVFRGFTMEKHMVQIIETSIVAASLVTTAAGILVAVPAICFYNYLSTRIGLLRSEVFSGALISQRFPLTKRFCEIPYALIAAPVLATVIATHLTFASFRPLKGFGIELASADCEFERDRPLVLRVTDAGQLFLGREQEDWNELASRLSEIHDMKTARTLYFLADDRVPFQTVANALDIVKNSPNKITVRLVTPQGRECLVQ